MKGQVLKLLSINLILVHSYLPVIETRPAVKITEKMEPVPLNSVIIRGYTGERINLCINKRIKELDFDQFVEPFRYRNETRLWQGEFLGKLMLAAMESYRYNNDPEMLNKISEAFKGLIATRTLDGYIGNYSEDARLEQWDVWCRKYTLLALLSYYDLTSDKSALDAAVKLADYTLSQLGPGKRDIVRTGNYRGMASSSILEPIVYLYRLTGQKRYLDFAQYIVERWESPEGPQLIRKAFDGVTVSERFPHPERWWSYENGQKAYEMMSCYDGLLELYKITGNQEYLKAAESTVNDIIKTEINIAGSGSSFECWYRGNSLQTEPAYHTMETCVTFTWMKLCMNLLRLTGNPLYADQIEKTAYNALMASMKNDGSQIAKYSPLSGIRAEGEKQCGMNINCCNANGPRGFMLLPAFAIMKSDREVYINLYSILTADLKPDGRTNVKINISTDYPASDKIEIIIEPEKPVEFSLMLRIPEWSDKTSVSVNGDNAVPAIPGTYYRISRKWNRGDRIILTADLTARLIILNGHQSIVRGPVVLARDSRFSDGDVDEPAVIRHNNFNVELKVLSNKPPDVWMAFSASMVTGTNLEGKFRTQGQAALCDFSSAGNTWSEESRYRVWIKQTLDVMNANYYRY